MDADACKGVPFSPLFHDGSACIVELMFFKGVYQPITVQIKKTTHTHTHMTRNEITYRTSGRDRFNSIIHYTPQHMYKYRLIANMLQLRATRNI